MTVYIKRNEIWTPDWETNLSKPQDQQIRFHHRFLTVDERDQYCYIEPLTVGDINVGNADKRKFIQDGKGIAKKVVNKIENLEVEDETGKKVVIDTIDKFYACPDAFPTLVALLEARMLTLTARVDEKK